ncbi:MAG: hypothetical protein ACRDOA_09480 [Streptosporangiaceae bacterium]
MSIKQSAWTGMVPVDDTAPAATDTGGAGRPVLYINGHFASQGHWRRVGMAGEGRPRARRTWDKGKDDDD